MIQEFRFSITVSLSFKLLVKPSWDPGHGCCVGCALPQWYTEDKSLSFMILAPEPFSACSMLLVTNKCRIARGREESGLYLLLRYVAWILTSWVHSGVDMFIVST